MKTLKTSLALVFFMFAAMGCSDSMVDANFSEDAASKVVKKAADSPTLVDAAIGNNPTEFNTLVAAVVAADLVEALSSKGQFTVFAPTDEAFQNAFDALESNYGITSADLLGNKELLTTILLYHVAPGRRYADSFEDGSKVNTLSGEKAISTIEFDSNGDPMVYIDEALVVAPNVDTFGGNRISNGVIHVIDAVILPPSVKEFLSTL
jgi:uncharacterized surface protein with fasciclin (FAS1) repeats